MSTKVKNKFKLRNTKPNKNWMKGFHVPKAETPSERVERERIEMCMKRKGK